MELIFILSVVFIEVIPVNFSEVMEIVRTFGVDTFMEDEVFPFFLWDKGIATMGAAQFQAGETALLRGELGGADFAQELSFGTVVPVQVRFGSITAGTGAVIRDIAFRTASDRADLLAITLFIVGDEVFVVPVLAEVGHEREFVNLELLVFWGMGVIKSPLFERDVSADETDQPAVLLIKQLN